MSDPKDTVYGNEKRWIEAEQEKTKEANQRAVDATNLMMSGEQLREKYMMLYIQTMGERDAARGELANLKDALREICKDASVIDPASVLAQKVLKLIGDVKTTEASAETVEVMYHDDMCGTPLTHTGLCPKCQFSPRVHDVSYKAINKAEMDSQLRTGRTFLGRQNREITR